MRITNNSIDRRPLRRGMAAMLLWALGMWLTLAAAANSDEKSDPLSDQIEALYERILEDPGAAWEGIEALKTRANAAQDRELWADWNSIAAVAKQALGEMDAAENYVAKSLSVYRQVGSRKGELEALLVRAGIFSTLGRYTESIEQFNIVIDGSSELEGVGDDDPRHLAAAGHNGLGDAYTVVGDSAAALGHVLQAYELYAALGDDDAISGTFVLLANIYNDLGATDKAIESYREALELNRESGDEFNVAINLYNMARAYTTQGDHQQAYRYYDDALEICERLGLTVTAGYVHYGVGLSLFDQGRLEDARQSFNQAAQLLESVSDHYMLARSRLHLAQVASRQGQAEASNRLLQQALGPFERTDSGRDLVEVNALFAQNYAALGQYQLAYEHESTRGDQMKALSSEQRAHRTAQLRVRFESAKAEAENRALSQDNELKQQRLEDERFYNMIILVFVFILVLVAVALSYSIWRQKQLEQRLKMLANTDDLTGLMNRRSLFELGRAELARAIRYQQKLSLLVLDLDYFKAVNDRYGHAVGDQVLKRVSMFLSAEMRDIDILGRVGGEEFVAVLPHTASDRASEVAKRLTAGLADLDLAACCEVAESISMSIGVAWLRDSDDTFQVVINRADAALYEAKAAGRNTVRLQSETSKNS